MSHRLFLLLAFLLHCNASAEAQVWQLGKPGAGQPGFMRGFGEHIYVGDDNNPGLQLTRSGMPVKPTVTLSEADYPGRSLKYAPLVTLANDGGAFVMWVNGRQRTWQARRIGADGVPQGSEMTLPDITAQGWWLPDFGGDISSNGEKIVFAWQAGADIRYQLLDFSGTPLTAVKQANEDTTVIDSVLGEWHPGASHPSVFVRADGSFTIAWQDERKSEWEFDYDIFVPVGDVGEIYARRFDNAGEPLGDSFRVNQDSLPRVQTYPAVSMNDAGTLLCFWLERDTARVDYEINVVRGRVVAENFSRDLRGSGSGAAYRKASVTASASGFAALWQQNDSLLVQAFDAEGGALWQPRNIFRSPEAEFAVRTLAADSYLLVWSRYSSPDIQARLFNAAQGTLGDEQLIASGKSYGSPVGVANRGLATAYLSTSNTAVNLVLLHDNLQPQHQIERLNTDLGGARNEQPDGMQLRNGNYLAVWNDGRKGVTAIYGQIFNANGEKSGLNFPLYLPAEHSNHQTPSLAGHPVDGAVLAYRSQTNHGADHGAWLQRLAADGSLVGPPVRIDRNTGAFIWDVKVASLPESPFAILATWREGDQILGRLFDSDLTALGISRALARTEGEFNLYADKQNQFWLMVRDYATSNLCLSGFDSGLQQFAGPTQLNDSATIVNFALPQMAFLSKGRMLAVWAKGKERSSRIDAISAQVLHGDGSKSGGNFRVSSRLIKDRQLESLIGFSCTASDSLFVVSWNTSGRPDSDVGIVWLDQDGILARPPTVISEAGVFYDQEVFLVEQNRLLFLHENSGEANIRDISITLLEPTVLETSGWFSSPIFSSQDSLLWKKLSWIADTPAGTDVQVAFRSRDDLQHGEADYIPWQQVQNGQTTDLPGGKNAQWRVQLQGTEVVSPLVFDLVGEYDIVVGVSPSATPVPATFRLEPPYPNPTRLQATLVYQLPAQLAPTITLYNILGQQINQWHLPPQAPGRHSFRWNGENKFGARIANGVYFFKLEVGQLQAIRKLAFIR